MPVSAPTMRPARRLAVSSAVLGTAFLALSGLAFADTAAASYPPGDSLGTVSSGTARPGQSVTFAATGFDPAESIAIAQSAYGTTTEYLTVKADAGGTTSAQVALSTSGFVTLSATGQLSGHMATSVVSVSGNVGAEPVSRTTPYSLAGISWLSLAAVVLAVGMRLIFQRSAAAAAPKMQQSTIRSNAAAARPRSSGTGGKHRKH